MPPISDLLSALFPWLVLLAFFLLLWWKIFTKAGEPGWAALVPVYNVLVMARICGRPVAFGLLYLIPGVGQILLAFDLAAAFGKSTGFAIGLLLLAPIFYAILAFGEAQRVPTIGDNRGAALAGSLVIVYHLGSVLLNALSAPSGPWPSMEGAEMAMPPPLVAMTHEKASLPYLRAVQMTHNFHFRSNRGGQPEAFLEINLEDEAGQPMKTVRFPDPKASSSVRERQASLTRWLTDDQPLPPGGIEKIPAPGAKIPEVAIWRGVEDAPRKLTLTRVPENEIPRDQQQVFRPSEWSLIVVRAIARNLCREYGASAAEVVRHSREPIPVRVLFEREAPPEVEDLQSSYGRQSR